MLILHGGNDKLTYPSGSQFLYDNVGTPADLKQIMILDGLLHEVDYLHVILRILFLITIYYSDFQRVLSRR